MSGSIAPYLQAHLAGAAAGIRLFGRSQQRDPRVMELVASIHADLIVEREFLRGLAADVGVDESRFVSTVNRTGLGLARLALRGPGPLRSSLHDVAELEAMRDAVSAKIAGWHALLAVVDRLPCSREELDRVVAQAERQREQLIDAHARVCARDLTR